MSTRDQQGEIVRQRCYVRKPGPRSEEPFTAEEWRGVFERCLRVRRQDMLDAIRVIVQGPSPTISIPENDLLSAFLGRAQSRWRQLVDTLPTGDAARMPLGYYDITFRLAGIPPASNFIELRRRLDAARAVKYTGWGPFVALGRTDLAPNVVEDAIETWLGAPEVDRFSRTSEHCDFWRASRDGLLYMQRGYDEDGQDDTVPGTGIDVTLPIWRVSEAMLFASRLSLQFGPSLSVTTRVHYTGLRNRELITLNRGIILTRGRRCSDNEVILHSEATGQELEDNIVEIVHVLLAQFYERFAFFELTVDMVRREIERMRRGRF